MMPYTPEESKIIKEALNFTKEKIVDYYLTWSNSAPKVSRAHIDMKREKITRIINDVIQRSLKEPPNMISYIRYGKHDVDYDIIRSDLYIFSPELQKAIDPKLPRKEERIRRVENVLNNKRFSNSKTDLFLEEYRGFIKDKKTMKKLLFFSYSSKDKIMVGKICNILEKEYNYNVFRAHDTIEETED